MYEALLLIPPGLSCNIADISRELKRFYGSHARGNSPRFTESSVTLKTEFPGLAFVVRYSSASHVILESREIAERFGKSHPERAVIAQCPARFEVHAEGDDPGMEYFNDYVYVVECGQRLGAIAFDPQGCIFM